jgi:hypothetical protein
VGADVEGRRNRPAQGRGAPAARKSPRELPAARQEAAAEEARPEEAGQKSTALCEETREEIRFKEEGDEETGAEEGKEALIGR